MSEMNLHGSAFSHSLVKQLGIRKEFGSTSYRFVSSRLTNR